MSVRDLVWNLSAKSDQFNKEVAKSDKLVDGLKKKITGFDGDFSKMFKSAGSQMMAFGKSTMAMGAKMSLAALPLTMKLRQGIEDVRALDTEIRKVTTLADDKILPRKSIEEAVKRISNEAGIAQTEISDAMYEALSSGVSSADAVEFTESGIKLVRAGFTSLPTAIDATTTALNAYGDRAFEVSKIHDIFVKTQDLGKITVDELASSIGRVIPTAASAYVGLDQLGAAYSILTAKGQNAQIATTNINSLLAELSTNGSKSDKVLRQKTGRGFADLSKDGTNLAEVLQILNDYASSHGLALGDMFGNMNATRAANSLGNVDEYNKTLLEMQNSDGTTDANFEKMMGDELAHQQATERIKNAWMELSRGVAPIVGDIMTKIGEMAMKFQSLDPETQRTIASIAGLLVVAGPLVTIFGALATVGGGLLTVIGFLATPIGAVVALIGLLGAAALATGVNFESMKSTVLGALETIKQKWQSVKEFFANPIKGIVSIANNVKAGYQDYVKNLPYSKPHATGLNYVPNDGYRSSLHKGEMVLTEKASKEYRSLGGTKDGMKGNTGTVYSPSVVININGNGDRHTANEVSSAVRKEFDKYFRMLQLQRV